MKLEIRSDSQNYACTVINLPVKQTIPGLDNLVKVEVFGNDCLIGKDSDPNELYLFFPAGSKLSPELLKYNNLYREEQLNLTPGKKGFFEPNGRVKGIKLKGIVSNGFVTPWQTISFLTSDIQSLKVNDEFTTIDGVDICQKYIAPSNTPGTPSGDKQPKVNNKLRDMLIPTQFRFHKETEHLAKHLNQLQPDDIIVITDKWHGSSCILSNVNINVKLNKWQRFINKIKWLPNFSKTKLAYIYSSGKPKSCLPKGITGEWQNTGQDFYNTNIWEQASKAYSHAIEQGISVYSELVGFETGGGYIQKGYDYRCEPKTMRMVVYRITLTQPDGRVFEFSWPQLKAYCAKYELEHVKEFYYGNAKDLYTNLDPQDANDWRIKFFSILQNSYNMEMNCKQCVNKVPAEGLVLRVDSTPNFEAYKLKSKLFILKETTEEEPEKES